MRQLWCLNYDLKVAVYNSEETKYIMFYVIAQDTSMLLLSTYSTKENVVMTELMLTVTKSHDVGHLTHSHVSSICAETYL